MSYIIKKHSCKVLFAYIQQAIILEYYGGSYGCLVYTSFIQCDMYGLSAVFIPSSPLIWFPLKQPTSRESEEMSDHTTLALKSVNDRSVK